MIHCKYTKYLAYLSYESFDWSLINAGVAEIGGKARSCSLPLSSDH